MKPPRGLRWLVLVGSLAAAFGVRLWLDGWLRWHSPFALLLPAVLVTAWYGGAFAGLTATFAGGAGAILIFLRPAGFSIAMNDAVAFGLFLVEGSILSGLCEVLHRAVDRAQTSAKEAGRKFEVLANSAPVLIWSTDPAGRCLFVNHHWCLFTGRTREEELDRGWLGNIHADDLPGYQRNYAQATERKTPYQLEYRLRRADGTYRWLLEQAIPRRDAEGGFEGFTGSCLDITAFRREREDQDFIARLQRSLGASLDLARVVPTLAHATVPHLADWFSLERVQAAGRRTLLHSHPAAASPPAIAAELMVRPTSAHVVETGEMQFSPRADLPPHRAGSPHAAEWQQLQGLGLVSHLALPLLARGRIIGVLTLATTHSNRILGPEEVALAQKIAGIAGFALDNARLYQHTRRALTHAEQTRQRLAESESELGRQRTLLKTIIDAVPALVAYVGPDGRILLHNEKYHEWLGWPENALAGLTLPEAHPGTAFEKTTSYLQAALSGETISYEDHLHAAGANRHVAVTLRPDRDGHGRVRGAVFHAYDITDRSQAYSDLATARELLRCHADELEARVRQRTATLCETNAELEAFTYSVSHDLRTPLQFIRSFIAAVTGDRDNRLTPDSRNHLELVNRAAGRMEAIIHDLLDYSRVGRADITLQRLSLEDAVAEAINHHQVMIQQCAARLVVDSPLPDVLADPVGLFQILANLISNALKFSPAGQVPVIRLRAEPASPLTRLWVMDNGIGIAARHHEKIFQLFERLHHTGEYPGTGIGLALVRKAVTRMGGRCGVESVPGQGSRFWIDFPPVETAPPPSSLAPDPAEDYVHPPSMAHAEQVPGGSRIPA